MKYTMAFIYAAAFKSPVRRLFKTVSHLGWSFKERGEQRLSLKSKDT